MLERLNEPVAFFLLINAGDCMEFLSTIGLVYLMFSAGPEVDINQFMRVRGRASKLSKLWMSP